MNTCNSNNITCTAIETPIIVTATLTIAICIATLEISLSTLANGNINNGSDNINTYNGI